MKNFTKNFWKTLLIICISTLIGIVGKADAAQDPGRGYTVTPPIFELKANPGDTLKEVVSVYNNGSDDLSMFATTENLKTIGEVGQVEVSKNDEGLPSLKKWVDIKPANFDLKKGATQNVTFTIRVPGNASPGGHFATVLFGTKGGNTQGTGTAISQRVGTLVLLTIAGQTKETANILSFEPEKKLFWNNQTIKFDLKVKNNGNVYVRPRGFLVINNVFGHKTAQVQIDGKNILPGATRQIPLEFKSKKLFGPYTATLSLVYGTTNQNLNSSTGFTIIPWKITSVIVVLLILVIILRQRLWQAILVIVGRR